MSPFCLGGRAFRFDGGMYRRISDVCAFDYAKWIRNTWSLRTQKMAFAMHSKNQTSWHILWRFVWQNSQTNNLICQCTYLVKIDVMIREMFGNKIWFSFWYICSMPCNCSRRTLGRWFAQIGFGIIYNALLEHLHHCQPEATLEDAIQNTLAAETHVEFLRRLISAEETFAYKNRGIGNLVAPPVQRKTESFVELKSAASTWDISSDQACGCHKEIAAAGGMDWSCRYSLFTNLGHQRNGARRKSIPKNRRETRRSTVSH